MPLTGSPVPISQSHLFPCEKEASTIPETVILFGKVIVSLGFSIGFLFALKKEEFAFAPANPGSLSIAIPDLKSLNFPSNFKLKTCSRPVAFR
jgi:hypothetical protein